MHATEAKKRSISEVDTAGEEEREEQKPSITTTTPPPPEKNLEANEGEVPDPPEESNTIQSSPKKVKTTKSPSKPKAAGRSTAATRHVKKEESTHSTPSSPTTSPIKSGASGGGGGKVFWSQNDKWAVLDKVIQSASPDWDRIAREMGKTRSQVYDQWRKSLYPELKTRYGQ